MILYSTNEITKNFRVKKSFFVKEYTAGNIPDYQAAALAMAIFSME